MTKLWVGNREGSKMVWVYDPDLEHVDQKMVYLFSTKTKKMKAYEKAFSRNVLQTMEGSQATDAIKQYLEWKEKFAKDFLDRDTNNYLSQLETRREETKRRHEEYLEKFGKENKGTSISKREHRVTHCYNCTQPLESGLFLECNSCSWLICYCGACGCGFEA
jgi:hypothetical protein